MKLGFSWIVPGQVIYVMGTETATYPELSAATRILIDELDRRRKAPQAHLIFNSTGLEPMMSAFQARKLTRTLFQHPHLGWYIHVNPNASFVLKILSNTACEHTRLKVRSVPSLALAAVFLNHVDPDLPTLTDLEFRLPDCIDIRANELPEMAALQI